MVIDLFAGVLIAFGIYQGYRKGLINTVFATISIIIAVVAALKLSPVVIRLLQNNINFNSAVLFVIGFVLTFILVLALIRFIGDKLEKLFEKMNINIVNKAAGAALLGIFYAILLSYAIHLVDRMQLVSEQQKSNSISYPVLNALPEITQGMFRKLQPVFSEFWDAFMQTMDDIKEKSERLADDSTSG